jgi:DNA-binding MarR family transcriptional regulator
MNATKQDVKDMVTALFTLIGSLERARRRIPDASALNLLGIVAGQTEARTSEIAALLEVHPSSVTRQVQALQRKGYVNIAADPHDRRSGIITLSQAGREEAARLNAIGLQRFETFVADWDTEDVRTLTRLLVKLEESKAEVGRREAEAAGRQTMGSGSRRWQ